MKPVEDDAGNVSTDVDSLVRTQCAINFRSVAFMSELFPDEADQILISWRDFSVNTLENMTASTVPTFTPETLLESPVRVAVSFYSRR